MMELYEHLYSGSIFDWELRDGSSLNEIFKKTFWHLNHYNFSNVDRDVLGHLYEQHLPKEERKTLGEFYTPTEVVNFILDRLEYTADKPIEHKDILDPATGSGTFLVQAANRLVERLDQKGVPPKRSLEIIQSRLHGLDLNPFAVNIAQINLVFQIIDLYKEVKDENTKYTIENFKIYQTDSLKRGLDSKISGFHSDTIVRKYQQEKQEAETIKDGEYDIVIGNPPYVYYNDIPRGDRETYNEAFPKAAYRQYDILILFIDSIRDWLKPNGKVGYITSNKFTTNQYGEKLRKNMPRHVFVEEFIDFADAGVFEDAVNYPCVFVMKRKTEEEEANTEEYSFPFIKVKEEMEDNPSLLNHIENHFGTEYEDEYITSFPVSSESLEEQSWKFIPDEDSKTLNAIHDGADHDRTFDDACEDIELGIKAGELPVYLITDSEIDEHDLETEIIHPVLEGSDLRRWRKPQPKQNIIYANPEYNIDEYPNIKSYLKQHKSALKDRTGIDTWWELREPRSGAITDEKKIISPSIAYYNNFTFLDGEGYPVNTTYYAVPKDESDYYFLLGLANSIIMQFYMRMEGTPYQGSYLMYYGHDWGLLPITRNEALEEEISAKTREIIEFIEDLEIADEVLSDPSRIYDSFDVDVIPLTEHPSVQSLNLGNSEIDDPIMEKNKIKFQDLTTEIEFFEDEDAFQELLYKIVGMKDFKMAENLEEIPLPNDDSLVPEIQNALDEVSNELETAGEEMQKLQDELDELVLDLYSFDEEEKQLIRERTDTPSNPLDTRMVITD